MMQMRNRLKEVATKNGGSHKGHVDIPTANKSLISFTPHTLFEMIRLVDISSVSLRYRHRFNARLAPLPHGLTSAANHDTKSTPIALFRFNEDDSLGRHLLVS